MNYDYDQIEFKSKDEILTFTFLKRIGFKWQKKYRDTK